MWRVADRPGHQGDQGDRERGQHHGTGHGYAAAADLAPAGRTPRGTRACRRLPGAALLALTLLRGETRRPELVELHRRSGADSPGRVLPGDADLDDLGVRAHAELGA